MPVLEDNSKKARTLEFDELLTYLPEPTVIADWSRIKTQLDQNPAQVSEDWIAQNATVLFQGIRRTHASHSALKLFGAPDVEWLNRSLPGLTTLQAVQKTFPKIVWALLQGETSVEFHIYDVMPRETRFDARIKYQVPPSARETWDALIMSITDVSHATQVERTLSETQDMLTGLIEHAPVEIAVKDTHGHYILANPKLCENYGLNAADLLGKTSADLFASDGAEALNQHDQDVLQSGRPIAREIHGNFEGVPKSYYAIKFPIRGQDQQITAIGAIATDITERLLEAQNRQLTQGLQAVSQFTSGTAHEFNNLLAVVAGCAELMHDEDIAIDELAGTLQKAASKGARLTRQLLAFSGQSKIAPDVLQFADLRDRLQQTVETTVGPQVTVSWHQEPDVQTIWADPDALIQIFRELAENASDSMPSGGTLTLSVKPFSRTDWQKDQFAPPHTSDFVEISLADTGEGMTPEVRDRALEPFFSTKDVGKGSGLGLSMVYGSLKQMAGYLLVKTDPGQGTNVRIYLPTHNPAS